MSRTLLMVDGEKIPCPTCFLARNQQSYLELGGKSYLPMEDRPLLCRNCGRTFESVRWFWDYFVPYTVPKIEAEMKDRNTVNDPKDEERKAEWRWARERKVANALEAGTWNPMIGEHLR